MTTKSNIDAAKAALNDTDWSSAEVDTSTRSTTIVHSTRLPAQWSAALEAEATARGTNPAQLMKDFVIAGLQQVQDQGTVTVSRAALHQALDAALGNAA